MPKREKGDKMWSFERFGQMEEKKALEELHRKCELHKNNKSGICSKMCSKCKYRIKE